MGGYPDVGGDEVVLKFVEQVGLFAQQQLVAGAGVEGEQRKGAFVHGLVGGLRHFAGEGGRVDGLGDEGAQVFEGEQGNFGVFDGGKGERAGRPGQERVVIVDEEIIEPRVGIVKHEAPRELLSGGVDEEGARLAGHHEGDVRADAAGCEDGVAGRIFFCGEHVLQLVELSRAEVAVLLQEENEGVHG